MKKFINKYKKHFFFFGFALLIATVMALFEIQIEGSHGWASQLPTWRVNVHIPMVGMWQGYKGKPLTGYHLYLWLFSFLLPHIVFLYTKWTWKKELNLLSFYIFYTTLEGLLWFILNPAWGWSRFRQGVPWYKEYWLVGIPFEYWIRFILASMLYYFSQKDGDKKVKTK